MKSTCIHHHDRETSLRCVACLLPICEECVVNSPEGRHFCSQACVERAREIAARAEEFRRLEVEDRARQARRAGRRAVTGLLYVTLMVLLVVLGWSHLPNTMTVPIEEALRSWL